MSQQGCEEVREVFIVQAPADATGARRSSGTGAATLRRVVAFIDGPGRIIVLFAIVLMFVRIFLD